MMISSSVCWSRCEPKENDARLTPSKCEGKDQRGLVEQFYWWSQRQTRGQQQGANRGIICNICDPQSELDQAEAKHVPGDPTTWNLRQMLRITTSDSPSSGPLKPTTFKSNGRRRQTKRPIKKTGMQSSQSTVLKRSPVVDNPENTIRASGTEQQLERHGNKWQDDNPFRQGAAEDKDKETKPS